MVLKAFYSIIYFCWFFIHKLTTFLYLILVFLDSRQPCLHCHKWLIIWTSKPYVQWFYQKLNNYSILMLMLRYVRTAYTCVCWMDLSSPSFPYFFGIQFSSRKNPLIINIFSKKPLSFFLFWLSIIIVCWLSHFRSKSTS